MSRSLQAFLLVAVGVAAVSVRGVHAQFDPESIVRLEKAPLERWGHGDPDGDRRINGRWQIVHSQWSYTEPDIKPGV